MDPLVSVTSRFAAYIPSDDRLVAACWYDRHGLPGRMVAKLEPHAIAPIISSSGRLAVARRVQGGETWLISLDLQTGAQRRLTSPEQWNSWPIWSARGDHVIYMSGTKSGVATVREMDPLDPSTHRDLYTSTVECWPVFQTPDQTRVMLGGAFTKSSVDLVSVALAAGTANSYAATSADETDAVLLSDGHTVALVSNPTGTPEIYLDTFPVRSQAIKITSNGCELSTGGVRHALWLVGDELIYIAANERTVRSIRLEHAGGRWIVRDDEPLFDIPYDCRGICPAPDGKKFLVLVPDGAPRSPSVALVENWKSALGH